MDDHRPTPDDPGGGKLSDGADDDDVADPDGAEDDPGLPPHGDDPMAGNAPSG